MELLGVHNIVYGVNSLNRVVYLRPYSSSLIFTPEKICTEDGQSSWKSCGYEYTPQQMTDQINKRNIRLNSKYHNECLYIATPQYMETHPNSLFVGMPM